MASLKWSAGSGLALTGVGALIVGIYTNLATTVAPVGAAFPPGYSFIIVGIVAILTGLGSKN